MTTDLFYEVDSDTEATRLHKTAKRVLDDKWKLLNIAASNNSGMHDELILPKNTHLTDKDHEQINLKYTAPSFNMPCQLVSLIYSANNPPFEGIQIQSSKPHILNAGIICNDDSKTIRYGVR